MSWKGRNVSGPCVKCGTWRERLQTDHIIPRRKGGGDDPSNIQYLCANCHEDKTRAELRECHSGRKHSPEHIAKRSEANRGRVRTPEQKERIRQAALARAEREGPEYYRRIRKVRNGQPWSAERRARYEAKRSGAA
jgi:hypothetical protein